MTWQPSQLLSSASLELSSEELGLAQQLLAVLSGESPRSALLTSSKLSRQISVQEIRALCHKLAVFLSMRSSTYTITRLSNSSVRAKYIPSSRIQAGKDHVVDTSKSLPPLRARRL